MVIIVICLLTEKKIYKIKANNNTNFPSQFHLGSIISNKIDYADAEEESLKRNVYDFSVDFDAVDESDI